VIPEIEELSPDFSIRSRFVASRRILLHFDDLSNGGENVLSGKKLVEVNQLTKRGNIKKKKDPHFK
jgi:hypothetical protein